MNGYYSTYTLGSESCENLEHSIFFFTPPRSYDICIISWFEDFSEISPDFGRLVLHDYWSDDIFFIATNSSRRDLSILIVFKSHYEVYPLVFHRQTFVFSKNLKGITQQWSEPQNCSKCSKISQKESKFARESITNRSGTWSLAYRQVFSTIGDFYVLLSSKIWIFWVNLGSIWGSGGWNIPQIGQNELQNCSKWSKISQKESKYARNF